MCGAYLEQNIKSSVVNTILTQPFVLLVSKYDVT